jgi:hypothetical protein
MAINERLAFAAACALSILAGLAVDGIAEERKRAAVIASVVVIALAAGTYAVWAHELGVGIDPNVIRINALAELLPLVIIAILLLTPSRLFPLILILLLGQRMAEDGAIYPSLPRRAFYPKIPILSAIPKNSVEPFRVAGAHFVLIPDSAALYQLEDPRGYEAMTFARLADTFPLWSVAQPVSFNAIGDLQQPFLSFLNIKYAIVPTSVTLPEGWREVMRDRTAKLFENTRVLPRAFVPRRIRYERRGEPVLRGMSLAKDFADVAWIETPEMAPHEVPNGPGVLTLHKDGNGLFIDADMAAGGWVVASQSAWKGWRAYIDNRRVEVRFANHAFLGVFVPKGRHQVRLQYLPESFTRGRAISFGTLGVLVIVALARRRFQKPGAVRV